MKIFNYKEFQKKYDKQHWNRLKNRKTYDFWTLSALLSMFGYSYTIEDTVTHGPTKRNYDLIKFYKKHTKDNIINKDLTIVKLFYLLDFIMPKVGKKVITRQYKYAPEICETFIALRTL